MKGYVCAVQTNADEVFIYWEHSHVPNIQYYNLYRRISEERNWTLIAAPPVTTPSYTDKFSLHHAQNIYYRVMAYDGSQEIEIGTDDTMCWKPDGLRDSMYWLLKEEIRRLHFGFQSIGEDTMIAVRKWSGSPCPVCFEHGLHSAVDPGCNICFGTGWVGGYDHVNSSAYIGANPTLLFRGSDAGVMMDNRPRVWMLPNPPILFPYSYVFRQDGQAYLLNSVLHKKIQGKMVYQNAQLQVVSSSDPIYRWQKQMVSSASGLEVNMIVSRGQIDHQVGLNISVLEGKWPFYGVVYWGDETSTPFSGYNTMNFSLFHTYANSGSYKIVLHLYDAEEHFARKEIVAEVVW